MCLQHNIVIRWLFLSIIFFIIGTIGVFAHEDIALTPGNSAVPPFRDRLHVSVRPFAMDAKFPYTPREAGIMGQVVADVVANTLARTGVVHVLDDATVLATLEKKKLTWTHLVTPATMATAAKSVDVDLLVQGTLTSLGLTDDGAGIVATLATTIYDAKSGKIFYTFTTTGINAESSLAIGDVVSPGGKLWMRSRKGRALRLATELLAEQLLAALPVTGQVINILPDGASVLDVGYTLGVSVGDTFTCQRVLQQLNEKGEVQTGFHCLMIRHQ